MSYNNFYMRLRVTAVQEFDKMYNATNGFGNGSDVTPSAFPIRVIWII
mgnify:CR=1 FL=1